MRSLFRALLSVALSAALGGAARAASGIKLKTGHACAGIIRALKAEFDQRTGHLLPLPSRALTAPCRRPLGG